jgi:hypothetical protein
MTKWFIPFAIAAANFAAAGDEGLTGPVTGFVADAVGRSIRPIEGVPGAARLGAPLRLPFPVGVAAIASRQDYALVTPAGDTRLVLARGLRSGSPDPIAIPGAIEVSRILVSRSGAAAVVVSASGRMLQFLTGLPADPRALAAIDAGALEGGVAALALDDDGSTALLASAGGAIWRARRDDGALDSIAQIPGASSITVIPERDAAAVAARETGEILLLEALHGAISVRGLAGPASGIGPPRALQGLDRATLAVIAGDGRLAALRLESGDIEWLPAAAPAERFDSLDGSRFVLNHAGPQPLLVLDAARERFTWFVPPDRGPAFPRRAPPTDRSN